MKIAAFRLRHRVTFPFHSNPFVPHLIFRQMGDYKPYELAAGSKPVNDRLHGSIASFCTERISPVGLDCRGTLCLYEGELDLKTCQCKCPAHTSGRNCEDLDCSALSDHCAFGQDASKCKQFANIPPACPKLCGLCDRYDAVKAHYQSTSFDSSGTRSTPFVSLLIQCSTIVVCRSLFPKE